MRNNIHPLRVGRADNFEFIKDISPELYQLYLKHPLPYMHYAPIIFLAFGREVAELVIKQALGTSPPMRLFSTNDVADAMARELGIAETIDVINSFSTNKNNSFVVSVFGKWALSGRNVVFESDSMHSLLQNTDMGNVPLAAVSLPFDSFFISFSQKESNFVLHNEETGAHKVDGIYISYIPPGSLKETDLSVLGTKVRLYPPGEKVAEFGGFQVLISCLPNENSSSECDDHTNSVLLAAPPDWTSEMAVEYAFNTHKQQLMDEQFCIDDIEKRKSMLDSFLKDREDLNTIIEVVTHTLKILLYMTARKDSPYVVKREHSDLLDKLKRTSGKKRDKYLRRSTRALNIIELEPEDGQIEKEYSSCWHMSPHFRKAHFRRVWIGKERSEQRVVWIHSTIVRSDLIGRGSDKEG